MSDPTPTTISNTQPDTTPPAIPPIKPGVKTSEAWVTLILMILGWLPSSGLLASSPIALQIVGLALSFLSGGHYVAQRSSLKRTTALASGDVEKNYTYAQAAAAFAAGLNKRFSEPAKVALLLFGFGFGVAPFVVAQSGCGATGRNVGQTLTTVGQTWLACEKADLGKVVDPNGNTLLGVVAIDLLASNYADLIATLVAKFGNDAIGCAVLAVEAVAKAQKPAQNAMPTPLEIRASEMIQMHGWRPAPAATTAPATAK